jgi:hypothetical protein
MVPDIASRQVIAGIDQRHFHGQFIGIPNKKGSWGNRCQVPKHYDP